VSLNGIPFTSDITPFAVGDQVYLPLRALAETLGLTIDYAAAARQAVVRDEADGTTVGLSLDTGEVTGAEHNLLGSTPLAIVEGRILVPTDFVTEYLNRAALYIPRYDYTAAGAAYLESFAVFTNYPVRTPSGVGITSLTYQYKEAVDNDGHLVSSQYTVPQLSGLKDTAFQAALNQAWSKDFYANEADILQNYQTIKAEAAEGNAYAYSQDLNYTVADKGDGRLTLFFNRFFYSGGAHGLESRSTYVLDLAKGKRLALADLFAADADYKTVVLEEINKILAGGGEVYAGVTAEFNLENWEEYAYDGYNFYLTDEALVLYYQPYDIAPYAAGIVEFKLPLENLRPYLNN
jgi:hypothetical protein